MALGQANPQAKILWHLDKVLEWKNTGKTSQFCLRLIQQTSVIITVHGVLLLVGEKKPRHALLRDNEEAVKKKCVMLALKQSIGRWW